MNGQHRASSLGKEVFRAFQKLHKDKGYRLKLDGLLDAVSSFDVATKVSDLSLDYITPVLAVANNLITRGFPTICSRTVEEYYEGLVGAQYDPDQLFDALHLVDTSADHRKLFTDDLESNFEHAFVNSYISNKHRYLTQFFQHQRPKRTLTKRAGDHGFVDFSFESPYFREIQHENRFRQNVTLKQRRAVIIEIDGQDYHSLEIDNLRDYETSNLGHNTLRVRQRNAVQDVDTVISRLESKGFFKTINSLRNRDQESVKRLQTLVLGPVGVARIQKVLNDYLISRLQNEEKEVDKLKVAVVERDVACGEIAIQDLNELYRNLTSLEETRSVLPYIEAVVYSESDFSTLATEKGVKQLDADEILSEDYDLIIDISVLSRSGVFEHDKQFWEADNSIIIRSSHYTNDDCFDSVYCSENITYRELTVEDGNEQHSNVEEALPFIEYFLDYIFRLPSFRKGQLPILNRALKCKSVIGLLPTGGGKSLTYQLAALLQPGISIAIDPIRSLMVDQYQGLQERGIGRCDFINSVLSRAEKEFVQNELLPKGKIQILFCSPERFVIEEFRNTLKVTRNNGLAFSYAVIDEAHCVSEWGHDFRTPYLNLGENVLEYCSTYTGADLPIIGLTATASFDVLADIERELQINEDDGNAVVRYENTVRDELNYQVIPIVVDVDSGETLDRKTVASMKLKHTQNAINGLNKQGEYLLLHNDPEVYEQVLRKTYTEYLPEKERELQSEIDFVKSSIKTIVIPKTNPYFGKTNEGQFNYGTIVFCPHRTGGLGVHNYRQRLECPNDEIVFFTGHESDSEKSFENLDSFKDDRSSVMVATKAFGMGIDKPNIRLTIHSNISSSIESFVQESGRAGRDGKAALSLILYNNQLGWDQSVLHDFHKTSFKGADKERATIWELRGKILFPTRSLITVIKERLSQELEVEILPNLGSSDWAHILFLNDGMGEAVGWINIQTKTSLRFRDTQHGLMALRVLRESIQDFDNKSLEQLRAELNSVVDGIKTSDGIETILTNFPSNGFDLSKPVIIPFENALLSKRDGSYDINDENAFTHHLNYVKGIISKDHEVPYNELKNKLWSAIDGDLSFEKFIGSLQFLTDDEKRILSDNEKLKIGYYLPRNAQDTAKAIHRLYSIGIIRTYTIDYQNNLYQVYLNDPTQVNYFDEFQKLVSRYTSNMVSEDYRRKCEDEYHRGKDEGKTTKISVCLKHLTGFVYDKIADKRKRAIDDMANLCLENMDNPDPIQQSEAIKEQIYYYFNAKYSRSGNIADTADGKSISADMNQDFEDAEIGEIVWKYIEKVIDYDDGGQVLTNVKHLRGATMRMLRGVTGAPQFNVLKAYANLFLASKTTRFETLQSEAIKELTFGITEWSKLDSNFEFHGFMNRFEENLTRHIGLIPEGLFDDVEDNYLLDKNIEWTRSFANQLLEEQEDAI